MSDGGRAGEDGGGCGCALGGTVVGEYWARKGTGGKAYGERAWGRGRSGKKEHGGREYGAWLS